MAYGLRAARAAAVALAVGGVAGAGAAPASGAVRGPVPVLGVHGGKLALTAADRLPDGSVVVAGSLDARAFAARVRASGVLDERFGRRGLWVSAKPSSVAAVRVVDVGDSARRAAMASQRVVLTIERTGRAAATVVVGADGRGRRGAIPPPAARCTAQFDAAGLRIGRPGGPAADALPLATGFGRPGVWRPLGGFAITGGRCGALLASGAKRAVVLETGAGSRVSTTTVASGSSSQVASRCLGHVLVFGVERRFDRAQLVAQAVDIPPARKASLRRQRGATAQRLTASAVSCARLA